VTVSKNGVSYKWIPPGTASVRLFSDIQASPSTTVLTLQPGHADFLASLERFIAISLPRRYTLRTWNLVQANHEPIGWQFVSLGNP
jgi:hypothetical protein